MTPIRIPFLSNYFLELVLLTSHQTLFELFFNC